MGGEERYIPAAPPGPRMVGGVLKWYAGDTFELLVKLELTDETGEDLLAVDACTLDFVFRNERNASVWQVTFGGIGGGEVVLRFDDTVTERFPKGRYRYDVVYNGAVRRTLVKDAPILGE